MTSASACGRRHRAWWVAAIVTLVLAGCAPSAADFPAAPAATASASPAQALTTIDHLVPRPDFVGPQPTRFAWTPVAGAATYAIGLVSEIDTVVWQTSGLVGSEAAWPAGLEVADGTYFWMVEGYTTEGRRIAESGRAAFVVER